MNRGSPAKTLFACLTIFLIAPANVALGQQGNAAFSVASIRKNVVDDPRDPRYISAPDFVPRISGGRVIMRNTLANIVAWAYEIKVKDYELLQGKWEKTLDEMYEIEAISPAARQADLRVMFQRLLAERFGLQVHRESRERQIYDLTVSRQGAKLQATPPDRQRISLGFGGRSSWVELIGEGEKQLVGKGATMDELAAVLSGKMDAPVRNQTGLIGRFDYNVTFTDDLESSKLPGLATAIRDIGLDLRKSRGKVDVVVVDSVQSASEN